MTNKVCRYYTKESESDQVGYLSEAVITIKVTK